jgi:hypothetical protein
MGGVSIYMPFTSSCLIVFHAPKLGHGTDDFTSPPKEGMLRIFPTGKIRLLRSGANPRSWVPEASMLTTRPNPLVTQDNFLH